MPSRALLIAINHYYTSMRPLKGPLGDAAELKEWLLSQGVERIDELLSTDGADVFTAKPVATEVEEWLDQLSAEASRVMRSQGADVEFPLGDRLYIFYGGHGYDAFTAGPTAIFPRTQTNRWDVFPFEPLVRSLKSLAYFREIVLLVDACREVIDYSHDPTWSRRPTPSPHAARVQVVMLNAADASQKTQELDFDGGRIRGVLSQAFLAAVKGLASEEGQVTAKRLREVVINAVRTKLPNANPDIRIPADPMTIARAAPVNPVLELECEPGMDGAATLRRNIGGESQVQLQVGLNVFEIPLGSYQLILANGVRKDIQATWNINRVKLKNETDQAQL